MAESATPIVEIKGVSKVFRLQDHGQPAAHGIATLAQGVAELLDAQLALFEQHTT